MCRLCGNITELSYEHTPPEAAFNSAPVVEMPNDYFLAIKSSRLLILTNQRGAPINVALAGIHFAVFATQKLEVGTHQNLPSSAAL